MLVELAERLGPSLDWWLQEPWAFSLWSYHQLGELDRRRQWVARAERLEMAELMMLAYNRPERLADERVKLIASAAGQTSAQRAHDLIARGERMARFIRKGKVLDS